MAARTLEILRLTLPLGGGSVRDSVETDAVTGNLASDRGRYEAAAEIDRDHGVASHVVGVHPVGDADREVTG